MPSSSGQKVYEIRDGIEVLGQFSVKTKAISFKRECSAEGRRVKVVTRFVKDSEKRSEPKAVPKRTVKEPPREIPKTVRKETPKPIGKDVPVKPREIPRPTVPKKVTEDYPKPVVKTVPTPNGVAVSGRTLKVISKLLKPLGISEIPIYSSSFFVVDPAHVAMIGVFMSDGKSLFGLEGDGIANVSVDIVGLAGKCSISSTYMVRDEGQYLILDDGSKQITAEIHGDLILPKCPNLAMSSNYVIDPTAFDIELSRVKGILNGGRRMTKSEQAIRLYGVGGDLMMSGRNPQGYGLHADIGDGDEGNGSFYSYSYLKVLADMFLLSDSQCTLAMDEDFPLEGKCSINGMQMTMLIAPMREE